MEYKYLPLYKYLALLIVTFLLLKHCKSLIIATMLIVLMVFIADNIFINNHPAVFNLYDEKFVDFMPVEYKNNTNIDKNCTNFNKMKTSDPDADAINKKYKKYKDPRIEESTIQYAQQLNEVAETENLTETLSEHDSFQPFQYDSYDQYNMRNEDNENIKDNAAPFKDMKDYYPDDSFL